MTNAAFGSKDNSETLFPEIKLFQYRRRFLIVYLQMGALHPLIQLIHDE